MADSHRALESLCHVKPLQVGDASGEAHDIPQAILQVSLLRPRHEPIPVEVRKCQQQPGQGFRRARVQSFGGERVEQDGRRIPPRPASTEVREPRIAKVGKFGSECVSVGRRAPSNRAQARGRQVQDTCEAPAPACSARRSASFGRSASPYVQPETRRRS